MPPKDLYSFPPNINSKYPSPSEDPKATIPTGGISSYLPPPSGPLSDSAETNNNMNGNSNGNDAAGGYDYKGPYHPTYLPPTNSNDGKSNMKDINSDDMNGMNAGDGSSADDGNGDNVGDDENIGVLPASAMDMNNMPTNDNGGGNGDAINDGGNVDIGGK